jgi:hypothetical protein
VADTLAISGINQADHPRLDRRSKDARRLRVIREGITDELQTMTGRPETASERVLISAAASLSLQHEKLMEAALAVGTTPPNLVEVSGGLVRTLRELGLAGRDGHGRLLRKDQSTSAFHRELDDIAGEIDSSKAPEQCAE